MKISFIVLLLSLSGCSHVIQKLSVKENNIPASFQEVTFNEVDLNDDGIIDKEEFTAGGVDKKVNIKTPIITGAAILLSIFSILYLIKIKNKK